MGYSEIEKLNAIDNSASNITKTSIQSESLSATGTYYAECYDSEGNLKWSDSIKNLVVTVGKNDLLDKYFSGSAYTAVWYMGLVSGNTTPTYAATDTLATHAGWVELAAGTAYTGNRITVGWSAASAGSKSSTSTSFPIIATNVVAGCLLANINTGTSGIMYSAGSFTGGNKSVSSGDTLNVTYTASV
jgi:hypothetical protein